MVDALIIGGGHNGLVCAFYLARAGLKVRILERRGVTGGAAITEEFHPGFRNSAASYTVSLLQPRVIRDMGLHGHGLRLVERELSNFLPLRDGRSLSVGGGLARTQSEFARFSARDAEALPAYYQRLETVADVLRDLVLETPPDPHGGALDLLRAASQGNRLRRLPVVAQRDLLDLFSDSAGDYVTRWFESEPVQAALGFDGVVGGFVSPFTPGTGYQLLHHVFGEVNGIKGAWGHAIGGMGSITRAMRAACEAAGVDISVDAPVRQVLVDGDRAVGVRLESGEELAAPIVAASVNPRLLFTELVPRDAVDADFRAAIDDYRCESATFRMNVALSELPDFTALPGRSVAPHHRSGIILGPSLGYMDRAYQDAARDGWSREPIVEILIPSTIDDSLAPPGAHVASLFCQHFRYRLPDGRDWDVERERAADAVVDLVTQFAPNFRASVIARQIHSPLDLERKFALVGGDIFHGRLTLDQLWAARPVLGAGSYRAPLRGLYLCGSGTHPGGGVTGAPGCNAAREILRDRSPLRRLFG